MNIEGNTGNRSFDLCKRVVTTESFIIEAKQRFGNKYDYSKTQYINREHRVIVTCPIHGDFEIFAREHLDGKGCPKCEKGERFISKLNEKFGAKFGTSEFFYKDSTTPVTLICPVHGAFSRLPNSILNSPYGCPQCGLAANQETCDQRHQEAESKKNKEKEAKEAERKAIYQKQIQELKNTELKYKTILRRWLANPNIPLPSSEDFFGGYDIYYKLVNHYKQIISHSPAWIDEYKNQHHLPYLEAKKLKHYQIGDEVYRFIGEAPDSKIIQDYKKNSFSNLSFNEFLSGSSLEVIFENGDLYIYNRSLLTGIKPDDIAGTQDIEKYRNMEEPSINPQRKVASQAAIQKYREQYPTFTDDLLTQYVDDLYPNVFDDSFVVAIEIVKELFRNQEELTEIAFKHQLVYWSDHYKLVGYTRACKKFEETMRQYNALIERIYVEAQQRTLYLSECPEYAFEGVKEYIDSLYEDKDKTLAQKLFALLNNRALRDSDQISGYVLPFHCYTEPNGDIIFTKQKRALNTNSEQPQISPTTQGSFKKFGCLSVIFVLIIVIATIGVALC